MSQSNEELIAAFFAKGGKPTKVPRSKRTLTDRHVRLLCQNDFVNLVAYDTIRTDKLKDSAGRRAQRGKKRK